MSFPTNPMTSLLIADIAVQLQYIPNNSFMGIAIKEGARERPKDCIKMVREQALDNRTLISDIVGEKLLQKIEKLFTL
jgi:hypothetical protein